MKAKQLASAIQSDINLAAKRCQADFEVIAVSSARIFGIIVVLSGRCYQHLTTFRSIFSFVKRWKIC